MYDHVIWPERYEPKISAIYALNDVDVKALISLSFLYNISFACNESTATLLIVGMAKG